MPALEVGRIPVLVDLDVPLTPQAFLGRSEQDNAIDNGLLDAESTELVGPIGNIGRKEAHGLGVLDDARELENLLPIDLRVLDLVQKHGDRVDGDTPGLHPLGPAPAS